MIGHADDGDLAGACELAVLRMQLLDQLLADELLAALVEGSRNGLERRDTAVSRLSSVRKISSRAATRSADAPIGTSARMVPLPGRLAGPAALKAVTVHAKTRSAAPMIVRADRPAGSFRKRMPGVRQDHCRTSGDFLGLFDVEHQVRVTKPVVPIAVLFRALPDFLVLTS